MDVVLVIVLTKEIALFLDCVDIALSDCSALADTIAFDDFVGVASLDFFALPLSYAPIETIDDELGVSLANGGEVKRLLDEKVAVNGAVGDTKSGAVNTEVSDGEIENFALDDGILVTICVPVEIREDRLNALAVTCKELEGPVEIEAIEDIVLFKELDINALAEVDPLNRELLVIEGDDDADRVTILNDG